MRWLLLIVLAARAYGQGPPLPNSTFLIEEAWRADAVVGQHTVSFDDEEWMYTWTHEWAAADRSSRFSWSLPVAVGERAQLRVDEVSLDYAHQLWGREGERIAVSPRIALLVPLQGDGAISAGVSLPITLTHSSRLASHWNLRLTWPEDEIVAGAGVVRSFGNRLMTVMETEVSRGDVVFSPGIRWSMRPGVVPGIAMPVTLSSGRRSAALVFHIMLEHGFGAF